MFLRRLLMLLMLSVVLMLTSCSKDPVERSIDQIQTLTELLEDNKEKPEALLTAFDAYVKENKSDIIENRAAADALDKETLDRLEAKHERELAKQLLHLFNVSLEVQDQLSDDPEELHRFLALMGEIGTP